MCHNVGFCVSDKPQERQPGTALGVGVIDAGHVGSVCVGNSPVPQLTSPAALH